MDLNRQTVQSIIDDTKAKGLPTDKVLDDLIIRGYNLEGIDSKSRREQLNPQPTQRESIAEKALNFVGGKELAQGAGQSLAAGTVNRNSQEALQNGLAIQNRLIERIRQAREEGDSEAEAVLVDQLQNVDFGQNIQQGFADDLVSDREVIGSAVQLAGTAGGGFAGSKAIGATKGLGGARQLMAGGLAEGLVQGAAFGAGDEIKNEDATLGSIAGQTLKQGALGAGIGLAGAGLIGGAGNLAGRASRGLDTALSGLDDVADSASSIFKKQPLSADRLTKEQIQAGIRPDVQKSIQGQGEGLKEYFDVTRKRLADETAKTPDGLLVEKAENAFQKTEDILSETGSDIGQARAKQGTVKASPEQAQSIMNTFDNEIKSLGLVVNKNGKLVKGKGIVDVSDAELRLLNETRNDILKVKGDSKLETIQKAVNKFRNRVNFGKQANEISDVVDSVSRKVSSTASDVNKSILGNEAGAKYTKYSEIADFLKETKNIRKNPQVALRRILSADSSKGLEFAETIKELTGIDLIKEARFARLAVDTFGGVNPDLGTRFRQQVAGSVLDSGKILNAVGGKAGAVGNIIQVVQDIPKAIRNESLLRQGIDPQLVDAEDLADLIMKTANAGKNTVDEIVEAVANPNTAKSSSILDSKLFRTVIDTDAQFAKLKKAINETPNKQGGFVSLGKGADEVSDLVEQAKKFDSGEQFWQQSGSKLRKEVQESQGIRYQSEIEDWWNKNVKPLKEVKEEILDTLNPTGGIGTSIPYTPELRATLPLGKNMTTLAETKGVSPDDMVTIYRGTIKSQKKINPGDFITDDIELAKSYSSGNILSKEVRYGDILDDLEDPLGMEYLYRPKADLEIKKTR